MNPTMRSLAILVTSAVAGFGSTLLCAWPGSTNAQGAGTVLAEQGAVGARVSKIGPLVASSHVIAAGGQCIVETRVHNPSGERVESTPIETDVYRTVSSPMARSMPMPTKVWQAAHLVSVDPGQEIALRDALAPALCAQIIHPAPEGPNDNSSRMAMRPVTSFHTAVSGPQPRVDAAPQRKARSRAANGSPASARQRKRPASPSYAGPVAQQAQVQQRSGG